MRNHHSEQFVSHCNLLLTRFACALALLFASAFGALASESAPDKFLRDHFEKGPNYTLEMLRVQSEPYDRVMANIASGGEEWLALASALYPLAEREGIGHLTYDLSLGVALALSSAPARVLPLLNAGVFPVERVCGDVDEHLTPEFDETSKRFFRRLQQAELAVAQFKTTKYAAAREKCLVVVRTAIALRVARRQEILKARKAQ